MGSRTDMSLSSGKTKVCLVESTPDYYLMLDPDMLKFQRALLGFEALGNMYVSQS